MPLSAEDIAAIYAKKKAPARTKASTGLDGISKGTNRRKMIRFKMHYPSLESNNLVERIPGVHSEPCTSHGCRAPSYYSFREAPLCSLHIMFALVYELNRRPWPTNTNESEDDNDDSYL